MVGGAALVGEVVGNAVGLPVGEVVIGVVGEGVVAEGVVGEGVVGEGVERVGALVGSADGDGVGDSLDGVVSAVGEGVPSH